ncbi:MAG: phage tail tube protein, partial [Candidatus Parvarchaeum sp.]
MASEAPPPPPIIIPTSVFQAAFGIESVYGNGPGTSIGVLGVAMSISDFKQANDFNPLYVLGSRAPQLFFSKGLVISETVKFVLAADNKNWLSLVLNESITTTGSTTKSTTFTWTIPPLTGKLPSAYMSLEDENGYYYNATGMVVNTASFSFNEGETCDVTLDVKGKIVNYSSTSIMSTTYANGLVYPTEFTTWANVKVQYTGNEDGAGTAFSIQPIKALSFKIENEPELYRGLGSIDYVAFTPTKLTVSGSIEIFHDSELIQDILTTASTQSSTNSFNLVITIGSDYSKPYTITVEGLYWDDGSFELTPVDPVVDK